MPAAAVIPAPVVYINVVVVKTLVVSAKLREVSLIASIVVEVPYTKHLNM